MVYVLVGEVIDDGKGEIDYVFLCVRYFFGKFCYYDVNEKGVRVVSVYVVDYGVDGRIVDGVDWNVFFFYCCENIYVS